MCRQKLKPKMKKLFAIGLLFVLSGLPFAARAQHVMPFEAKPLRSWYQKYPTITNLYNDFFYQVLDSETESREKFRLALFDVITAVDGTDTSKISMMDFEALFSQSDTLHLSILRKIEGRDITIKCSILQKNNRNGYGDLLNSIRDSQREQEEIRRIYVKYKRFDGIRVIADEGIDFASINTYDFMITGDDPLTDKKILEAFCRSGMFGRLRRDEENPDIIVCMAKNANESISSTYVPPTTQVVNTGSVTRPVYNYITHTTSFVTQQQNRYETSGGYTQTTTNTNIYLEFSILDARKLNDPAQKTAPVIWKMTFARNVTDRDFEILDEYLAIASRNCFPFVQSFGKLVPFWFVGATFDYGRVSDVVPNTPAAKLGLQKGDKIIKINGKKHFKTWEVERKNYYPYTNTKTRSVNEIYLMNASLTRYLEFLERKFADDYEFRNIYFGSDLFDSATTYTILRNGQKITLKGRIAPSVADQLRTFQCNPDKILRIQYMDVGKFVRPVDQK